MHTTPSKVDVPPLSGLNVDVVSAAHAEGGRVLRYNRTSIVAELDIVYDRVPDDEDHASNRGVQGRNDCRRREQCFALDRTEYLTNGTETNRRTAARGRQRRLHQEPLNRSARGSMCDGRSTRDDRENRQSGRKDANRATHDRSPFLGGN